MSDIVVRFRLRRQRSTRMLPGDDVQRLQLVDCRVVVAAVADKTPPALFVVADVAVAGSGCCTATASSLAVGDDEDVVDAVDLASQPWRLAMNRILFLPL